MKKYALDSTTEARRLENQSKDERYNFKAELKGFFPSSGQLTLDIGCGSGVVSRYLAELNPGAKVIGIDISGDRVQSAKELALKIPNLEFLVGDIKSLEFKDSTFDNIVCRYVLEHLPANDQEFATRELFRVLKPGGSLWVVDADGFIVNLYPQPEFVQKTLSKVIESGAVDFYIGRKIRHLLISNGFEVPHEIRAMIGHDQNTIQEEIELMRQRFESARSFFISLLGSKEAFDRFTNEYLSALGAPDASYFYTMHTACAVKKYALKLAR